MSITFIHGDCLEKMRDLPDKSVDCFVCDLPYGCLSINGKPKISPEKTKEIWGEWSEKGLQSYGNGCPWDVKIDLAEFWAQVKRLAKDDHTPVLMFCTTKFGYELIKSNEKWFRYDLVWDKARGVSFLTANKMPMRAHEMIYVFSKKGANYKRVDYTDPAKRIQPSGGQSNVYGVKKPKIESKGEGLRCVTSVIHLPSGVGKGKHPTEKPKELYRWLLERYCPEGTVLDPTAGSFNSCFAAQEMGLNAIGIEKDDTFFKKACPDIISHVE